jgi:saccharopine dehydrogenase-like NADP-dependent oxidoreductase
MSEVLVLGAGMVVRAHVRYLLGHGFNVTVASLIGSQAEEMIESHPNGTAVQLDIRSEGDRLASIIAEHDVVVSLVPWQYHPRVARACLDVGRHMVTSSYVSDEMRVLDAEAKSKGIILFNELGVDPGLDHMTAMKVIHRIQAEGGTITTFQSYCGGLPAPEANDNPFGYKFSWSPRGVLLAGLNGAKYKRRGEVVVVPEGKIFDHVKKVDVVVDGSVIEFEGYPNRDSMPYAEIYGIKVRDVMFRGTLRNTGWCSTMKQIAKLGWLATDEMDALDGKCYADLSARLAGVDGSTDLKSAVAEHLGVDRDDPAISKLEWLGLLSSDPLPGPSAPIDILTDRMLEKMSYGAAERDMVVLQHTFMAEFPGRRDYTTSTMVDFGVPGGDSAMNRTVGLPAAVGVRYILEGRLTRPGVVVPVLPEFYEPALEELQRHGIRVTEETRSIPFESARA